MEDKEKQTIKNLYKDMMEVSKVNSPDYYWMSIPFYDSIIKRILYLESELKLARKRTENWKKKYMELKK